MLLLEAGATRRWRWRWGKWGRATQLDVFLVCTGSWRMLMKICITFLCLSPLLRLRNFLCIEGKHVPLRSSLPHFLVLLPHPGSLDVDFLLPVYLLPFPLLFLREESNRYSRLFLLRSFIMFPCTAPISSPDSEEVANYLLLGMWRRRTVEKKKNKKAFREKSTSSVAHARIKAHFRASSPPLAPRFSCTINAAAENTLPQH